MSYQWLVTGAAGQFGSVLLRELARRGEPTLGLVHRPGSISRAVGETLPIDILDHASVTEVVRAAKPAYVIHAAAIADARAAFEAPTLARLTNVDATAHLARTVREAGSRFTFISTDLVFDGAEGLYDEQAPPNPLSVYGRTKADGEAVVLREGGLVVRTAIMYGIPAVPRATVFQQHLAAITGGERLSLFEDQFRSPIALADAASACLEATASKATGIFHVAGPERLSRLDMGRIMARALGASDALLVPARQRELEAAEPRPADVSLRCERFTTVFGWPPGRAMATVMDEIASEIGRR